MAERQRTNTFETTPRRGDILDRNGRVLAYSVDAESIFADPSEVENPDKAAALVCGALDRCDAADRHAIARHLRDKGPVRLPGAQGLAGRRGARSPRSSSRASASIKESRRFYPKRELLAHVLGYVGTDNVGLGGLESVVRRADPGHRRAAADHARRPAPALTSQVEREATAGASLELTIDQYLQNIAERELQAAVTEHRAAGGSVVIMDPNTGEILALANAPTFNPNTYATAPESHRRNRAIQDLYEPGSTFKIVTASAALEEGLMTPEDLVDVSAGMIRFGSRTIRRHASLRHAVVHRRDREVEQRRRDQGRHEARAGAARPLRQPLRIRPAAGARFPRREPRHRLGPGEARSERAGVGVDGLPGRRDAAADGLGGQLDRQRRHAVSNRASCGP